jgi:hypothetical protein
MKARWNLSRSNPPTKRRARTLRSRVCREMRPGGRLQMPPALCYIARLDRFPVEDSLHEFW